MASTQDATELLADARWLAEHRNAGSVVLVDSRPPKDYWTGHLEGARHFDPYPFSYYDTSEFGLQVFRRQLEWIFGALGIAGAETVVFYENDTGMRATRGAWALEYLGHPSVRLLDGGLKALGPDTNLVTDAPAITPVSFRAKPREEILATADYVVACLETQGVQVLDVRSDEEYYSEHVRSRHGGAIPGALHRDWRLANGPDGALLPAARLRADFQALGLDPNAEIITYCQGGFRAAHAYFALKHAGFRKVRNYYGSWGEWGNRDDLPIEHPRRPASQEPRWRAA